MTDCSICINPVVDHPTLGATGSHRSSCGHIFHPKCIAKWHTSHWKSTCPLCRKDATELEDCAPKPEAAAAESFHSGGSIVISRANMDSILRDNGGFGMTAGVEAEVQFDGIGPHDETTITRYELERIMREQGGNPFSDAMWDHLSSVHPVIAPTATVAPDTSAQRQRQIVTELATLSAELVLLMGPPLAQPLEQPLPVPLAEAQLPPLHYIDHPCALEFFRAHTIPPSYGPETEVMCNACNQPCGTNPFYHCGNCEFDVCLPCFVDGAARGFMQRMGL
jgi:hypothetical protein